MIKKKGKKSEPLSHMAARRSGGCATGGPGSRRSSPRDPQLAAPVTQQDQPEAQWSGCQRGHRSPNDSSPALSLSLGSRARPDWGLVVKWGGARAGAPEGHWAEVSQGGSTALRGEGGGADGTEEPRRPGGTHGAQSRNRRDRDLPGDAPLSSPDGHPALLCPCPALGAAPHRDAQTARTGQRGLRLPTPRPGSLRALGVPGHKAPFTFPSAIATSCLSSARSSLPSVAQRSHPSPGTLAPRALSSTCLVWSPAPKSPRPRGQPPPPPSIPASRLPCWGQPLNGVRTGHTPGTRGEPRIYGLLSW